MLFKIVIFTSFNHFPIQKSSQKSVQTMDFDNNGTGTNANANNNDISSDDEPMDLNQSQRKFFDVGKFDKRAVDLSRPAMDAEEYLRQVIVDRERQPVISLAPNYSELTATTTTQASTSGQYTQQLDVGNGNHVTRFGPDKEWGIAKSNEFSHNRSMLEARQAPSSLLNGVNMPPLADSMAWCQVCFERRLEGLELGPEVVEKFGHHKRTPPTLGLVKSLNDNQVNHLILYQTEYIVERGHTRARLEWLHALLLVVKKPLWHDVAAALREFCRKCRKWRAELDEDEMDTIYELSWFIAIISIYFAQHDLADH